MTASNDDNPASDYLPPVVDTEVSTPHRLWMNGQIEKALDHKRSGKATYKTLEETRRKFGF